MILKYLLLLAIRLYWRIPTKLHQRCIFRETCSHYVYRIASEQGFLAGIKAFKERTELCRSGYVIYKSLGRYYMKTANGTIFQEDEIALSQLPPNNCNILDLDNCQSIGVTLNK